MTRIFDDQPAEQGKMPLFIGLVGPSGSGKTFSALRLATGFQRLSGGEIYVIDTEARRALAYAPKKGDKADGKNTFNFRHLSFGAPFSPLDYLAAVEHCIKQGAKNVIIDSASHEHEGPGGVLEMHAAESKRLMTAWRTNNENAVKMSAWQKPKSDRRRFINTIMQMECNFIFCFRAKEKLKIVKGKDPEQLGYMPIAGDDFIYEMTAKFLLYPGANGFPTLQSDFAGEQAIIKLPNQFRGLFPQSRQFTEDLGVEMAKWAAGSAAPDAPTVNELLRRYDACSDSATYRTLETARGVLWAKATKEEKANLKTAADKAKERIDAALAQTPPDGVPFDNDTGEVAEPGHGAIGREPGSDDAP